MDENNQIVENSKIQLVPFIGLKEGVIFPETDAVLTFGRPGSISSVNTAFTNSQEVCFVSQKETKGNPLTYSDYYGVGTFIISKIYKLWIYY